MKRGVIRAIIVFAAISIVGIATTQIYWLKKAFDLNEDQFNRDVNTALYNVATQLFEIDNDNTYQNKPIEQLASNYYVVTINNEIDAGLLESLLKLEFSKRNIKADFEYGIYDCNTDKMVYCNYVTASEAALPVEEPSALPKWDKQLYYFGVYFPDKELQVINRMGVWIFSSAVLLVVILFFSYSSFVILKQKRLSEIQKDFINNMTHEFKTPISTIAVSSEVLQDPDIVTTPERLQSYVTIIQNENTRLKNQVDRVLQIATLEDEQISLRKEEVNLHDLIKEVSSTMDSKIEQQLGTLTTKLDANNCTIVGDRLHITNVIYNMVDNAVKYCGEKPPVIMINTKNEGNHLLIDFVDKGIGIAKSEQQKVFGKFYRVPTGNIHNVKGFGLGLYYVQLIVKAHLGSIKFTYSHESNSVFTIQFPFIEL